MLVITPVSPLCLLALTCAYIHHRYHYYIRADFKNPNDPHDRSFDAHPTNYPVGELEFPNSGATERYVFHVSLLPYVRGVWQCVLLPVTLHVVILRSYLSSTCLVRSAALKHDQTPPQLHPQQSIDDSCLSSPSPPHVALVASCHSTNAMPHVDLARFSFSLLFGHHRCFALHVCQLTAPVRPALPYTRAPYARVPALPNFLRVEIASAESSLLPWNCIYSV